MKRSALLDDAFAEGRGVVLTVPHWSGHELVAAVIARRHPMAMLVRQAPTSGAGSSKSKMVSGAGRGNGAAADASIEDQGRRSLLEGSQER